MGCGLWVVGCGLWVVGCGLWVASMLHSSKYPLVNNYIIDSTTRRLTSPIAEVKTAAHILETFVEMLKSEGNPSSVTPVLCSKRAVKHLTVELGRKMVHRVVRMWQHFISRSQTLLPNGF